MNRLQTYDLVVIGAGPAGMAAATQAAGLGLQVLIIDEQATPGGQIYRNVLHAKATVEKLLGPDYSAGKPLARALMSSGAETAFDSQVWDITEHRVVTFSQGGVTRSVQARQLIVATGAFERPSPVPGWTLPGVLNAGSAQIAMKMDGSIPAGRIVLAGCGPLMLLVARQLQAAGATVAAVVDTAPPGNRDAARSHAWKALRAPAYLGKGAALVAGLALGRTPWFRGATAVGMLGRERVEAVGFAHRGRVHRLAADTVLLHHGVIPNQQVSKLLNLSHRWNAAQAAWQADCDAFGQTALPGIRLAGDGVAIGGAGAARLSGAMAALGVAHALGRISDTELQRRASPLRRALRSHDAIRPFLDTLYRAPDWVLQPPDAVTVCRCENVDAGTIRAMAGLGCIGPNQTKFFSRCGMGPCQGRVCGTTVTQLLAGRLGLSPQEVGAYRVRSPLKPVSLSTFADLSNQP